MKNFSYTARDNNGALKHGTLQVADRSAALAALKEKGLTPVSVTAVSAPTAAAPRVDKRTTLIMGGMLVLLLAAAAWVFFKPSRARTATETKDPAIKKSVAKPPPTVQKAQPTNSVPVVRETSAAETTPPVALPPKVTTKPQVKSVPPPTNATPKLIRGAQTRLAALKAKGLPTEPLFKHEVENILALFADPSVDVPPHPFDHNLEEQAQTALAADIEVTDDDTPEQVAKKEMVAWLKEDMRQFMANGHTAAEFFAALQKRQSEDAQLYMEARQYLFETARETKDVKVTQEALDQLNAAFKEKGLPPLAAPGALRRATKANAAK